MQRVTVTILSMYKEYHTSLDENGNVMETNACFFRVELYYVEINTCNEVTIIGYKSIISSSTQRLNTFFHKIYHQEHL